MLVLIKFGEEDMQVELDDELYKRLIEKGEDAVANYCLEFLNNPANRTQQEGAETESSSQSSEHTENRDFWDDKTIKLLLSLRLQREIEFIRPTCKKVKLWQSIAEQFKAKGYTVNARDLEKKYNNLKQTYMRNKEKSKASGESAPSWPYFNIFDKALGHKANVQPPPDTIGDVLSEEAGTSGSSVCSNNSQKISRKRMRSEEELEFRKEKFRWQQEKFNVLVELEREKMRAIKELTEAIKNKNNNQEVI